MPTELLNFVKMDEEAGFRLHRLEIYNWGTFDRHVWRIGPEGHNSLLTGDIGSGKSTLVDAVTTLLVPHHRIVYNKAAGAESRERTLYSYIRGEFKSEKDQLTRSAKPVALRDDNNYTVLLGYFYNKGFMQGVTLAQVFWLKDQQQNPERFFVVAQDALTIADHFSNFGSNILDLKKQLRKTKQVEILDNFKEYGSRFRHLFGIHNPQAMDLFYQTVSLKSVGNLTEFVRQHMLEKSDVDQRLDEMRRNFENLNRAHEAIIKAIQQIEKLDPLMADCRQYQELESSIAELRGCREVLPAYFADHQIELLRQRIEQLQLQNSKMRHQLEVLEQDIGHLRSQETELKAGIDDNGGRRLDDLQREIARLEKERNHKLKQMETYGELAARLSLARVNNADDFFSNRKTAQTLLQQTEQALKKHQLEQVDVRMAIHTVKKEHDQLQEELNSLRSRKSNIPLKNLEIRREMITLLNIDEEAVPFVGELLQVDESASEWEGAIERLLHNFGLSLLVPEDLYDRVSRYVDRTHLKGRLVYYRMRGTRELHQKGDAPPGALIGKLRIKPDSPYFDWLESELNQRFDYICCDSIDDFRRLPRAITQNGQIKSGGKRHEKDDRHAIGDRRRFVLGWSNEQKIKALQNAARSIENTGRQLADQLARLDKEQQALSDQRDACRDLLQIETYGEIDWQPLAMQIQALNEEKEQIEQSSDLLQSLRQQLLKVRQAITQKTGRKEKLLTQHGGIRQKLRQREKEMAEAREVAKCLIDSARTELFPKLDHFRKEVLADKPLTLRNLDPCRNEVRARLRKDIEAGESRSKQLTQRIIRQMEAYKNSYPAETVEVDAHLEAIAEYEGMLTVLQTEDLPRHEARFKQLLNEGTINSIVLFQNQLDKEKRDIIKKIGSINASLREIEYNPGTYIELVTDRTQDVEVRDFQGELKLCLAHALDESDVYNESKFLQVKKLLDRFNGREGLVELDRKWTRKVTDVRQWFTFSAIERWQEDGSEKEYYSDSSGKSGGQKEKLAYTILASALAYQFGLEWGVTQSRSFRFVVIDEAFGKGSDESSRYGLELFKKLNLQLLIVTPLQKINIIEDYIRSVHFVYNQDGKNSMLRNLTIEEYREEKRIHQQGAAN